MGILQTLLGETVGDFISELTWLRNTIYVFLTLFLVLVIVVIYQAATCEGFEEDDGDDYKIENFEDIEDIEEFQEGVNPNDPAVAFQGPAPSEEAGDLAPAPTDDDDEEEEVLDQSGGDTPAVSNETDMVLLNNDQLVQPVERMYSISTKSQTNRNSSRDFRGDIPQEKKDVGPWMWSSYGTEMSLKGLNN